MIAIEEAQRQIARLDSTEDFHWKTPEAKEELTAVLLDHAEDEAQARRAISAWLSSERECPTPADLYTALDGAKPDRPEPIHGCPICRNRGYVMVYQLGTLSQGLNYRQRASMQDVSREVYEQLRLRLPEDIPAAIPTRERQFATTAARKCRCGQ
jgi:hypothetical protein